MQRKTFNYRHGKEVVENIGLLNEIMAIANGLSASQLSNPNSHQLITQAFKNRGWRVEKPVRGFKIDCFKNGVGLEVELSHIVHVYQDLFKFMILFNQGRLDAGILLTLDDSMPKTGLIKNHPSLPTISKVKTALHRLRGCVPVPILIIAIG